MNGDSASTDPRTVLDDTERALLAAIPRDGRDARSLRVEGLSPQKRAHLLRRLEEMGLAERYPNGHGPEEPWWWMRLPDPPEGEPEREASPTAKGTIYDRSEPGGRPVVFFECNGTVNEWGCAVGWLRAGENTTRKAYIPLHLLNRYPWWEVRKRGEVSEWASHFSCPIHGAVTDDSMITTDKTCALCGSLLNRLL